jgi:mRNA-degrading endonuclease RelE of RelBE toxin-antitoxin system
MSQYNVIPTKKFLKDMKYYVRKKNYYKLKDDMAELVKELEEGNLVGDEIPDLKLPEEETSYKVRMANNTTKVGKSNGFRIIYYVVKNNSEIYLLTVYEKADITNVDASEIRQLIKDYCI